MQSVGARLANKIGRIAASCRVRFATMRYQHSVHARPVRADVLFSAWLPCMQAGIGLLALGTMAGCSVVGATVAVGSVAVSAATTVASTAVSVASTAVSTTYDVGKAGVNAISGGDAKPAEPAQP